jgi:hypothetical protein
VIFVDHPRDDGFSADRSQVGHVPNGWCPLGNRFRGVSWDLPRDHYRGWDHLEVLLSLVYRLMRCLFDLVTVLIRVGLQYSVWWL